MRYIIMCGSTPDPNKPKQLIQVWTETIIQRTIRLLRENGIEDIAISSNNPLFDNLGVPVLKHENSGEWIDCFYPISSPTCFIFGDVVFSPAAIKKIVETETDKIEFFASAPPFGKNYIKKWAEPFAFKVVNVEYFRNCVNKTKEYARGGLFKRGPIAWEFWQVVKGSILNQIDYTNYTIINDYTCDIDYPDDLKRFEEKIAQYGIIRNE